VQLRFPKDTPDVVYESIITQLEKQGWEYTDQSEDDEYFTLIFQPQIIDIVFDGPPGPEAGRFVEVEDGNGNSIRAGTWIQRPDRYWVLRLNRLQPQPELTASS